MTILSFLLISQVSYRESAKILAHAASSLLSRPKALFMGPPSEPWISHIEELRRMVGGSSIIVASTPSTTLLNLGPFDVILNRNVLDESPDDGEYAVDRRVGRPVISTVTSLRDIMSCYSNGLVVVTSDFWRVDSAVSEEVANFLQANTTSTRMTARGAPYDLLTFEWQGKTEGASTVCDGISARLGGRK
jgi:hypothetical protein